MSTFGHMSPSHWVQCTRCNGPKSPLLFIYVRMGVALWVNN